MVLVRFGWFVKITPAHDPNDFQVGNRHNLKRINVMNDDGTMNEEAGKYAGMDRFECREALVADLQKVTVASKLNLSFTQLVTLNVVAQ